MQDPDLNYLQRTLEEADELLNELQLLAQRDGDNDLANRTKSGRQDVFNALCDLDNLRMGDVVSTRTAPTPRASVALPPVPV